MSFWIMHLYSSVSTLAEQILLVHQRKAPPPLLTTIHPSITFHQKLVMREIESEGELKNHITWLSSTPFLLLLLFYFWHSKYSSTKIFTVWHSFLGGWREMFFPFSLPPTVFCFKVNFVLHSTRNTSPRGLETRKEYQFSFRSNNLIAISAASDAHMLNLCTRMLL